MEPRPAATVVVARPSPAGVEVLMLTRGAATSFAPGFRVFPGGIVDPEDADLASRLFGDPGQSFRACALRELHEETGLLATAGGLVARDAGVPPGELGAPPPEAMPEIARWVAPEVLPVRFDARFFAVAAPPGLEPVVDGLEIEEARWTRPDEVLAAMDRGEASLMWPTLVTMQRLAECGSVGDVLALRMEQVPRPGGTS